MIASYSENPSSNPTGNYNFFYENVLKERK